MKYVVCTVQTFVNFCLVFFSQSTKMILKFRESTISRLERLRKREKEGSEGQEDGKDREIVSAKAFVCHERAVLQSY